MAMKHWLTEVSATRLVQVGVSVFLAVLVVFLNTGCNGTGSDATDRPSGSAAIVISALSASDVAAATVSVAAADIQVPLSAALSASNGWQTTLGGIPAGTARTFTLSATDANGIERYHGETASVTITPDQTQSVVIVAQQTSQSAAFADAVPVIDLAQVSSNKIAPGAAVTLNVTAHDPDPGDVLAFTWTASTGTFASPSTQTTTWTAPSTEGTYPITVAVRDSKQETTTATLQITVATPPVSAPIPRGVIWLLSLLLAIAGGLLSQKQGKLRPSPIRR
jgi:hypothetical protein